MLPSYSYVITGKFWVSTNEFMLLKLAQAYKLLWVTHQKGCFSVPVLQLKICKCTLFFLGISNCW